VSALIEARALSAGYGQAQVLREIELDVHPGEVVALLGANGAGKTTAVLSLAGELRPMAGSVRWLGSDRPLPLHRRARQGLALITEDRSVFAKLSVRRNLRLGRDCDLERAFAMFPELEALKGRRTGLLSGGEQQMLTVARALARPTRLLLADELSLGLAPLMTARLLAAIREAADRGMGALVVEQQVRRVLDMADRVYVLRQGRIAFSGTAAEARANIGAIEASYLSHQSGEQHTPTAGPDGAFDG
jgi:ABC-type branched-subunit amino acid transport system ATPase component